MVDSLFGGGGEEVPSQAASGYSALPKFAKNIYRRAADIYRDDIIDNPEQYFAPADIGAQEQTALGLIQAYQDPEAYRQSIEGFLSPYRDIVTSDINRAFEDQFGGLASRASEAGAFGGSRYRDAQTDLEGARLDSIARALNSQYANAQAQQQQTISNLLGFGGLERSVDLARRQALPTAVSAYTGTFNPLLSGTTSTGGYTTPEDSGIVGDIGQIAGLVNAGITMFSDKRLKKNIEKIGKYKDLNVYAYEYLWSPIKFVGFIAQEVQKLYPEAVGEQDGYKTVNYGAV